MAVTRKAFRVAGRVQGVFFRASTATEARRLGLLGWVRNNEDGSVEGVVEGPPERVDELMVWCRTGPPAARVDDLSVIDTDEGGAALSPFEVR
jgi:acylphosphatase